jgi:hypothetical protein
MTGKDGGQMRGSLDSLRSLGMTGLVGGMTRVVGGDDGIGGGNDASGGRG